MSIDLKYKISRELLKKEKEQVFTLPVIVELNEHCVRHIACILSTLFSI